MSSESAATAGALPEPAHVADRQFLALLLIRSPTEAEQAAPSGYEAKAPSGLRLEAVPSRAKVLSRNFHRLAAYNRDPAADEDLMQEEIRDEAARRARWRKPAVYPNRSKPFHTVLVPHVARADQLGRRLPPAARLRCLAVADDRGVRREPNGLPHHLLPQHYWLAFVELVVLLLGYASYRVSLHETWHDKRLNDRRLAEGLRTAIFTALIA